MDHLNKPGPAPLGISASCSNCQMLQACVRGTVNFVFQHKNKKLNESQSYLIVPSFRREHFRINSVVKWSIQAYLLLMLHVHWRPGPGYHGASATPYLSFNSWPFNSMIKCSIQVLFLLYMLDGIEDKVQDIIEHLHHLQLLVFQPNLFNNKIPNILFTFVGFSRSF